MEIQYIDRNTHIDVSAANGLQKAAVESFSRQYSNVMSVVRENSRKVKEINDKILELINVKRMYLLDSHTEVGRFLKADMYIANVRKAYSEYEKVGMKSKLVKSVVMDTRSLFFDDSLEEFREYEFISFLYDTCHDISLKLWFSNGSKEFAISVPGSVDSLMDVNKYENISSMFRVIFNVGKYCVTSMGGKMTVEGIREDLKKFISPEFVPTDRMFPKNEGRITPLDALLDKYYGESSVCEDVEIPYYFGRDSRTKGVV